MKWISKLKDGKELQKKRIIHQEINQNQEIYPDQEEEEYSFVNSLIPDEPNKSSKCGLKTSLIIVRGFLSRKNL